MDVKLTFNVYHCARNADSAFDGLDGSNGFNTLPDSDTDTDSDFCLIQK